MPCSPFSKPAQRNIYKTIAEVIFTVIFDIWEGAIPWLSRSYPGPRLVGTDAHLYSRLRNKNPEGSRHITLQIVSVATVLMSLTVLSNAERLFVYLIRRESD
jgi:hypothetical protein